MNGHRCTVSKVRGPEPPVHDRSVWEARCQDTVCGGRYLTEDGWRDALVQAVAHHYGSVHGWVSVTDSARAKVGWL